MLPDSTDRLILTAHNSSASEDEFKQTSSAFFAALPPSSYPRFWFSTRIFGDLPAKVEIDKVLRKALSGRATRIGFPLKESDQTGQQSDRSPRNSPASAA